MEVQRGRQTEDLDEPDLRRRAAEAERVLIDVGTGDGRTALRLARDNPGHLVIGLDPAADRMRESSARAARKPSRGGAGNVLFVVALVEEAPAALHGLADEVRVQLPWSGLLRGVVRGDPGILRGLRRLARDDALMTVTIGADIWRDPVPVDVADLAPILPGEPNDELRRRYLDAGFVILGIEEADRETAETGTGTSSWGRRLDASRRGAAFLVVRATVRPSEDDGERPPGTGP